MQVWRSTSAHAKTPVALTIGNFDGVHLGHQAMLARLKDAAKRLELTACVMTFEPHPREFFAPDQAPTRLTSLREKLELLAQSKVDRVQVYRFNYDFAKICAEEFIIRILKRELSVRWLLVGDDFRFGARRAGNFSMLQAYSSQYEFEVEEMPGFIIDNQRVSSTRIRQALAADNLRLAKHLLGRPYSISGRVVDGDKLGKKLGFPTANIQLKHNRPPLSGIFVVEVHGAIKSSLPTIIPGVASLGVRPTTHDNGKPILEIHLLDFSQNIYGHHLRVDFLHKLRDEEKYPNLAELSKQIAKDIESARNYFLTAYSLKMA
ncbi:FMN adenylyltransferase /riboflavin kinase [Nitrosomonas cryotolerans]|uniref:Riboflavin biosynthesis protein n=1 Tax=Nitrosomonas cryotolerans ATCC 49181 TaxID=1131553 RepID=A0A1N6FN27_9PROT|nr:bifunctional riboflavin kinase/FAD synthetase [Nitrosomonas cryotolerans]SFP78324.1 FMN adenylyltransferase /riboflavin kinase [Nitrosomonas cryotolerans]SIN96638.1 FMN adenylyltransferase /riboflavin kinase [Nitrosomonas cryotolerans ATCC 49181]